MYSGRFTAIRDRSLSRPATVFAAQACRFSGSGCVDIHCGSRPPPDCWLSASSIPKTSTSGRGSYPPAIMYFRPSASDCDSSERLNFMNIRPIAAWARFPYCANSGDRIIPAANPTCANCCLLIWLTEWRAVTCPISWPRMAASSASEFMWAMMPRVT